MDKITELQDFDEMRSAPAIVYHTAGRDPF